MTQTLTVEHLTKRFQLACLYPRQMKQQPCRIYLDCQRAILYADYAPEMGSGVPLDQRRGRTRGYNIPCLTAEDANALLDEIAPLAERIVAGYRNERDYVAMFNDDAVAAEIELEAYLDKQDSSDDAEVTIMYAADYPGVAYGVTGAETDDDLARMATETDDLAADENVKLIDTLDYLQDVRQRMLSRTD